MYWDYIVKLCLAILSISILSSNLFSVYLLSNILYSIADNFSIYLFALQYERFLIMNFIKKLIRNLSILYLIVFEFAKW